MRLALIAAVLLWAGTARAGERLDRMLNRISEEAEVFQVMAPKLAGRETLHQRARRNPSRFRPRVGAAALKPPVAKYQTRDIVSEYAFSSLAEAPNALLEIRQIVSADGHPVVGAAKARETLTIGLRNNDNRAKKRMLKRFEKLGLKGAATDFGQLILLFRRENLKRYRFTLTGERTSGGERVAVLRFAQRGGPESFTIFQGRRVVHSRLEGEIWVRATDFVPVRIRLTARVRKGKQEMVHRGEVAYRQSPFGVLLPSSVRYRQLVDGETLVENDASYSDFHLFAVDATIRFEKEGDAQQQLAPVSAPKPGRRKPQPRD